MQHIGCGNAGSAEFGGRSDSRAASVQTVGGRRSYYRFCFTDSHDGDCVGGVRKRKAGARASGKGGDEEVYTLAVLRSVAGTGWYGSGTRDDAREGEGRSGGSVGGNDIWGAGTAGGEAGETDDTGGGDKESRAGNGSGNGRGKDSRKARIVVGCPRIGRDDKTETNGRWKRAGGEKSTDCQKDSGRE